MIPDNIDLHLASSLSAASEAIRHEMDSLHGKRLLLIDTARRGEGRPLPDDEPLPMTEHGCRVEVVDIRGKSRAELESQLESVHGCVLLGGNTYVLMHAIRETEFARLLEDRASRGGEPFLVIGESAGALVMGESIAHAKFVDDPQAAPEVIEEGIGWVGSRVLPHVGCEKYGLGEKVEAILAADNDPMSFLQIHEEDLASCSKPMHQMACAAS